MADTFTFWEGKGNLAEPAGVLSGFEIKNRYWALIRRTCPLLEKETNKDSDFIGSHLRHFNRFHGSAPSFADLA